MRFVDGYQPGIVECKFRDADDKLHSIVGKLPYFTSANLWSDSNYPQPGDVECTVLDSQRSGQVLVILAEETTDGTSEILIHERDLIP